MDRHRQIIYEELVSAVTWNKEAMSGKTSIGATEVNSPQLLAKPEVTVSYAIKWWRGSGSRPSSVV